MISNSIIFDTFIFSSLLILIGFYNIIIDLRKKKLQTNNFKNIIFVTILLIVFPILITLLAVMTYNKVPRLGIVIYLILFIIIVGDFIYKRSHFKIRFRYSIPLLIIESLYLLLTPIIGFPVLYLSTSSPQQTNPTITKVDTKVIQENFEIIKNKFVDIENLISNETKNIDSIYSIIYNNIQEKNVALQNLNNELYEVRKQLELYKSLANVSEKEAESIKNIMESNKYIDYLIGLIIGVISSLVATYTIRMISKNKIPISA